MIAGLCLSAPNIYATEQPLVLQSSDPLQQEFFIQDWITFNKSQWNQAIGGTYSPESSRIDPKRIIQRAQQGLMMNATEILRLNQLQLQTAAYQKLVALKINQATIDKKVLEQIIASSEVARPKLIETSKITNAILKSRALEQQYEIKNLNYFKRLIKNQQFDTQKSLSMSPDFFKDWINYKLLDHQVYSVPKLPLDSASLIKSLNSNSNQKIIAIYQQLNPATPSFKQLVQLKINQSQHAEQLFNGISKEPKSVKQAQQNLRKISQIFQSAELKQGLEMGQQIERLEQQFDHQVFTALSKYYALD